MELPRKGATYRGRQVAPENQHESRQERIALRPPRHPPRRVSCPPAGGMGRSPRSSGLQDTTPAAEGKPENVFRLLRGRGQTPRVHSLLQGALQASADLFWTQERTCNPPETRADQEPVPASHSCSLLQGGFRPFFPGLGCKTEILKVLIETWVNHFLIIISGEDLSKA